MSLYTLVYCSLATKNMEKGELADLLSTARRRNSEQDITGILLYHQLFFIQVLEGDENDVKALFSKIKDDKRHRNVQTLFQGHINRRSFADWSMGFKVIIDEEVAILPGFSDFLSRDEDPNGEAAVVSRSIQLIESFKRLYVE